MHIASQWETQKVLRIYISRGAYFSDMLIPMIEFFAIQDILIIKLDRYYIKHYELCAVTQSKTKNPSEDESGLAWKVSTGSHLVC